MENMSDELDVEGRTLYAVSYRTVFFLTLSWLDTVSDTPGSCAAAHLHRYRPGRSHAVTPLCFDSFPPRFPPTAAAAILHRTQSARMSHVGVGRFEFRSEVSLLLDTLIPSHRDLVSNIDIISAKLSMPGTVHLGLFLPLDGRMDAPCRKGRACPTTQGERPVQARLSQWMCGSPSWDAERSSLVESERLRQGLPVVEGQGL